MLQDKINLHNKLKQGFNQKKHELIEQHLIDDKKALQIKESWEKKQAEKEYNHNLIRQTRNKGE